MRHDTIQTWFSPVEGPTVSMRCPQCRQWGTFEKPPGSTDIRSTGEGDSVLFAIRRCPNPTCHGQVFVVTTLAGEILASYPPDVIDFDSSNLPPSVLGALTEAIQCHAAGCYRASAVMVRRTLEDVCADQQVEGDTLYKRIEALGSKVTLPAGFLQGLHDLRLLGNDAVHVELKDFDAVDEQEVSLAIGITKKLLEALYQYDTLMKQLADRKRQLGSS